MLQIHIVIDHYKKHLIIYDWDTKMEIDTICSLKQHLFFDYMCDHFKSVDLAVIPLVSSYRNTLYVLYPRIKIIIDKEQVMALFRVDTPYLPYEVEVAATTTLYPCEVERKPVMPEQFIVQFYQQNTQRSARTLYHWWQINIPIHDKSLYRYIRNIEYFDQEIFNYFDK